MAVAATNTEWYAQTSSTQTMRTWSEVLSSYAEVPAEFQAAFPKQAADFPYTVLVPEDRLSFLQKRSAKLLCLYDDRIIHLSILTAQELILIRESKRTKTSPRNLYGGVFTYIPLRQIQDIAFLAEPEHARRVMQITLADKIRLRAEFALDNPEFDTFQKEWQQRL
jgi:hypothetical protein